MLNAARFNVFQRLLADFNNLISSAKIVNDLWNVDQMKSMMIILIRDQILWWFDHKQTKKDNWVFII